MSNEYKQVQTAAETHFGVVGDPEDDLRIKQLRPTPSYRLKTFGRMAWSVRSSLPVSSSLDQKVTRFTIETRPKTLRQLNLFCLGESGNVVL